MSDLGRLLNIIERQLNWGPPKNWHSKDFEELNVLIFEKTNVSLSASTLRRVWGRIKYQHLPSITTLDTLARFAGYDNWRVFSITTDQSAPNQVLRIKSEKEYYWRIYLTVSLI